MMQEIINYFEYDELAYYDESLGGNDKPSQIIDIETNAKNPPKKTKQTQNKKKNKYKNNKKKQEKQKKKKIKM